MCFDKKKVLAGGIAAGAIILIVSTIISTICQQAFSFNVLELAGMRSINDPIMILFFVYPWVLGFAMAIAFQKFKGSFKCKGLRRGQNFGLYVWLLAGLPSAFLVWSSMAYPIGFTVNSLIGSFLYMIAAGIVLEKVAA
jgi:hypothetical protein